MLLGIQPKNTKTQTAKDLCMAIFNAAPLKIPSSGNNLNVQGVVKVGKKFLGYIHNGIQINSKMEPGQT